jgi:hypothetical protein
MKIIRKNIDQNLLLNKETHFKTDLGWGENFVEYEKNVLKSIINPIVNYETLRFTHEPYTTTDDVNQFDIWYQFFFLNQSNNYTLNYNNIGIDNSQNQSLTKQVTNSFFRLEFFKTPDDGVPNRTNRKLVITRNLPFPLGERLLFSDTNSLIYVPVFNGNNFKNTEVMYLFWFYDDTVLEDELLSGDVFWMSARFYNAGDGTITDFTNKDVIGEVSEEDDVYFKVIIDKENQYYIVREFDGIEGNRAGTRTNPIKFYQRKQ